MIFERDYFIHYYQTGLDGKASLVSVLRMLEDIAILHCESLDLGLVYNKRNNVGWMLSRWYVEIKRMPEFKETIKIKTEPKDMNKYFANREYKIYGESGEEIASANSLWIFVNTDRRKPIMIPKDVYEGFGIKEEAIGKLDKLKEVESIGDYDIKKKYHILADAIDANRHTNNSQYISFFIDALPSSIMEKINIKRLIVNYLKETKQGDELEVLLKVKEGINEFRIVTKISNGEKEVCRAEIIG